MNRFAAETVGLDAAARDRLLIARDALTAAAISLETASGAVRELLEVPAPEFAPITDPLMVVCPACQVPAGEPCTQATESTRVPVKWIHHARITAVTEKKG